MIASPRRAAVICLLSIFGIASQTLAVDEVCPSDFDGDFQTTLADFARFRDCMAGPAGCHGDATCVEADLTTNGAVDLRDFATLALRFQTCDPCAPRWQSLGPMWGNPGASDNIIATTVFDDGCGPAIYVGGSFRFIRDVIVNGIAKWDGSTWSPLGTGIDGVINAMVVFDDGTGPALYVGGHFNMAGDISAFNIAKWNGAAWAPVGPALGSGQFADVRTLGVFDDGTGPSLYAGGWFFVDGTSGVAKWTGESWSALGTGLAGDDPITHADALAVFDDGSGPALFVGGNFGSAGGIPTNNVAKWDGATWSATGSGLGHPGGNTVSALVVFDDGTGPALYAAQGIHGAGYPGTIARWNGISWTNVGTGITDWTHSFAVFDEGGGPGLFVCAQDGDIARWDGTRWNRVGCQIPRIDHCALTVHDDGTGPALYSARSLEVSTTYRSDPLVKWDSTTGCSYVGFGGMRTGAYTLTSFDDGGGPALFAGGSFGIYDASRNLDSAIVVKLDGTVPVPLNEPSQQGVYTYALAEFDDGGGPALYAGGSIYLRDPGDYYSVVKWDGSQWQPVGDGLNPESTYNPVHALTVFDDGSGPTLIAGGDFSIAEGQLADHIAQWDGKTWTPLGEGVDGVVYALAVFDDGAGPALFAAGEFVMAGGVAANSIARWDGASWTPVGDGLSQGAFDAYVYSLAVFDDGTGPALFVGGSFTAAGDVDAHYIAKWDGATWTSLGSGMDSAVYALAVFDDGSGPALYAGGFFSRAGDLSAKAIARWDGTNWAPLGSGVDFGSNTPSVRALAVLQTPTERALFAAGGFTSTGGVFANRIAKWYVPNCKP